MSIPSLANTFRAAVEKKVIPGTVLVATNKSGSFNYAEAFGNAGVSPTSGPLTLDSTFRIASCLFALNSPEDLARLLPVLSSPNVIVGKDGNEQIIVKPASQKLTMRQLLTHTSGFGYSFLNPILATWSVNNGISIAPTVASGKLVHRLGFPLLFEPGEKWIYGVGLDWAGKMVERANNGMRLESYMRENIYGPLGMENTTYDLDQHEHVYRQLGEMAIRDPKSEALTPGERPSATPIEECYGGAGVYSRPTDYIKILASLLKNDGQLLKSETVEEMFKPQLSEESKDAWMKWSQASDISRVMTSTVNQKKDLDWGLGGMLFLDDDPITGGKKGTLAWGGLPNLFWWIDREAGVCGMYASQVLPVGDPKSAEMYEIFQREIYEKARLLESR